MNRLSDTLYLDIFSGISGDMFLGALLDLGLDFETWQLELQKLGLEGYSLKWHRASRSYIEGIKLEVIIGNGSDHEHHDHEHHDHEHHDHEHHDHEHHDHEHHDHEHHDHEHHDHEHSHGTDFASIRRMIQESGLSDTVKSRAISIFHRIAIAEGKVHGLPIEKVHFHEVGAVDSIVDIVGACIGWDMLGLKRAIAAPVVEGRGWIDCAHGRFPIPAAATLEILSQGGIAVTQCDEPNELVTPTGAAILAEFVDSFEGLNNFRTEKIGYGIGTRHLKSRPNVLRAIIGSSSSPSASTRWDHDEVVTLETNLDDCSPEVLGHCQKVLMQKGALDVYLIPMTMKKSRPAHLLGVICSMENKDQIIQTIFQETSSFGIRETYSHRNILRREIIHVEIPSGVVRVKVGRLGEKVIQIAPEFDDCQSLAEASGLLVRLIIDEARNIAMNKLLVK